MKWSDYNVVLTRTVQGNKEWSKYLSDLGINSVSLPMLNIVEKEIDYTTLLQPWDALIFTSSNAITIFTNHISLQGHMYFKSLPSYCIGSQTYQVAQELGYNNLLLINDDERQFHKEAKILWPCANSVIKDYDVNYRYIVKLVVYETVETKQLSITDRQILSARPILCFFASPSAVFAWKNLDLFNSYPNFAVAIGNTTAAAISTLNIPVFATANQPNIEAMVVAVEQSLANTI
ncbi:MAG: uroporphyrinogen-III synthase [Bacteroidota bacterium]|nr:uroporphyrinogen-III synthase [Bacteroidota bacterium]